MRFYRILRNARSVNGWSWDNRGEKRGYVGTRLYVYVRADEHGPRPERSGTQALGRTRSRSPIRAARRPFYSRECVESERRTAGCETELPIATALLADNDRSSRARARKTRWRTIRRSSRGFISENRAAVGYLRKTKRHLWSCRWTEVNARLRNGVWRVLLHNQLYTFIFPTNIFRHSI